MNCKKISNIKFLNIMKNFPKLLYEHQFILCSGGSTIWEALYLNKKPLVINTSVKQFENSKNLSKDGLIKLFHRNMTTYNIKKFLLSELKLDKTYFKRKIVDGYGLNRITKEILNEKRDKIIIIGAGRSLEEIFPILKSLENNFIVKAIYDDNKKYYKKNTLVFHTK